MDSNQLTCLQIHNDYQIQGGETKTAQLIADLLERHGIKVIRYYKTNMEFAGKDKVFKKIKYGVYSLNNPVTTREINDILDREKIDFALIHNVIPVISNSAYKVLIKRKIPIIKYLQNYNLVCLNGALNHGENCIQCQKNSFEGVRCKCYKGSTLYSFIKYMIKQDFDSRILSRISAFMSNSDYVMKKHSDLGIDARKMHVMYNYINIEQIQTDDVRDYYLYFGRLAEEKGVLTTISAFEHLKKYKLLIIGSGDLEEAVKQRMNRNILYIGEKKGTELLEYVAKAKAVIVPSEWDEPLPRTILEAYSQGTPVIGSDRGGIVELLDDETTGYIFKAGNVNSLMLAVERIEGLGEKAYKKMRENCRVLLNEKYSEKAYYQRFYQCIISILSKEDSHDKKKN